MSAGRLALSGTKANLTVLASDDPYGVFVFEPDNMNIFEQNASVALNISRQRGTKGAVRVNFTTVERDISPNVGMATPNTDYMPINGSVVFTNEQSFTTIRVRVFDDSTPEPDETVLVNLTSVELIGDPVVLPGG